MAASPVLEAPRQRLEARGAAALTDAELLAILIRPGSRRGGLAEAESLLRRFGRLSHLLSCAEAECREPAREPGLAPVAVAMELARRALAERMRARDSLGSPAAVRDYLRLQMQDLAHEAFYGVFLDAQNRALVAEELFRGTLTQTSVYPREVVKRALAHNAAAIILAHNHPSGVAEPSFQDQALTRTLTEALALVDVRVLDHFIVVPGACLSFAERGLL